jgi:3-phosphoshikimate 1-carboxyvinyltransferase
MNDTSLRGIQPASSVDAEISVPPSKSYTNRALIVAALAEGTSSLLNPSIADDVEFLLTALEQYGIHITRLKNRFEVQGTNGKLNAPSKEIYVGNAGTAMRFLTTFSCLAKGETILNGDENMQKRPINDLLDALRSTGIKCTSNNGCPPIKIVGGGLRGGRIEVDASVSSQFVSSLLLSAPYARQPVLVQVKGKPSSLPYVDMSVHVMRSFGAEVNVIDELHYEVSNTAHYIGREFHIEADASAATYFLAAAAITKGRVLVKNLPAESLQGDMKFIDVLSEMGCKVVKEENGITLEGVTLKGIDVDMNSIPDCVPTLAVVAAFADGPTTITNVHHLQYKETDRLKALTNELIKIGAKVERFDDGFTIYPQPLHGATIETYNDHRMAMSFAVAGLKVNGIAIKNPSCVSKSFPNFWDEFKKLENGK